ncbi:MAG: iolG 4 [Verrucomicrobiaceae bacterium]|nr:iolG 4 [Verrucomicrobiaceae bacterium]
MDCDSTGPVEMKPLNAKFPPRSDVWNTATEYQAESTYANGVKMLISNEHADVKMGAKWVGSDGWVWVDRSGFDSSNADLKEVLNRRDEKTGQVVQSARPKKLGDDVIKVKLYDSPGHQRNFLDCVKSHQPTITPVTTGHHSAIPGHLALIALMTNSTIKWDPEKEVITGNEAASKLLNREYRGPWKLEA